MKTILLLLSLWTTTSAFVVLPPQSHRSPPLFATSLPEIDSMRITEIRQELESYGISTKSFLEKKEMVNALQQARKEGKKPKKAKARSKRSGGSSREERIAEEMETATRMKVTDLKKALEDRGVSTKSFFEKSEFVKAYAEAVVDGVKGRAGKRASVPVEEEEFDASYRDVSMQKMDKRDPRLMNSKVIDIRLGR